MSNNYYKNKKAQPTFLELLLVGIGKGLWWLITLPFHKGQKRSRGISSADRQYIIQKRHEIEGMSDSENIYELKHAVIEADKLVDYVMKTKGYGGETFADRLRNAESYMDQATYQRLWDAHKIRNQIAHQDDHIEVHVLKSSIKTLLYYTSGI